MIDTCIFCKGSVKARLVEHIHTWRGNQYIFRNDPAEVCIQFGEMYFAPDALEAIDDIVKAKPEPEEHRLLPLYSLS